MTYKNTLAGTTLVYDYGNDGYEVTFKSENLLHWRGIRGEEKGMEDDETYIIHHFDDQHFFVSWVETSGAFVAQYINLAEQKVNTYLVIDEEVIKLYGHIKDKNSKQPLESEVLLELNTDSKPLVGKNLIYNYDADIYHVAFKSESTLNWRIEDVQADEVFYNQLLDENKYFLIWVEDNGSLVSQVLNLNNMNVVTVLVENGKHHLLEGVITTV